MASKKTDDVLWEFFGFESVAEGRPVQSFYDALPEDHKLEITAGNFQFLRKLPKRAWEESPFYDPLNGEGGISEIRITDIRDENGAHYYRFYGYFGPGDWNYTFLHGTNKKVRNDRDGKAIAKRRLQERLNNQAKEHKFDF